MLSFCAIDTTLNLFSRDVSQVYFQLDSLVQREVQVKPLSNTILPTNSLLKAERRLYRLLEARPHLFGTNHRHHSDSHYLQFAKFDPCFLHTSHAMSNNQPSSKVGRGLPCLQTDDTPNYGNK